MKCFVDFLHIPSFSPSSCITLQSVVHIEFSGTNAIICLGHLAMSGSLLARIHPPMLPGSVLESSVVLGVLRKLTVTKATCDPTELKVHSPRNVLLHQQCLM